MGFSSVMVYSISPAKDAKGAHAKRAKMCDLLYLAKDAKGAHAKRGILKMKGSIVFSRKDRKVNSRKEAGPEY